MKNNILYFICCLVFSGISAQKEQYVLNPDHTDNIITKLQYPTMAYEIYESDMGYSYVQKSGKSNNTNDEKTSFILGNKIDIYKLKGSFEKVSNYYVMAKDHGEFLKGELIDETTITQYKISKNHITLRQYNTVITNKETRKYYFVKSDFLDKFHFNPDQMKLSENTNSNALSRTYTLTYTLEKYEAMIDRCQELTTKLIQHNKLVQQGTMTKKQFEECKRDLVEVKLLNYRIEEFEHMYQRKDYPVKQFVNKEIMDNYDNLSKALIKTGKYAGFD